MKDITWKYVKSLNDSNAVKNFLSKHNIHLPKELIECLEINNGGRPSQNIFHTVNSNEHVFKSLLSYNKNDAETIYMVYPNLFKNNTLYPIGTDESGSYICYNYVDGKYVYWNTDYHKKEIIKFD